MINIATVHLTLLEVQNRHWKQHDAVQLPHIPQAGQL